VIGQNIYTGHALATYTLEPHFADSESTSWKDVINETLTSTRLAFPANEFRLVVILDKKSFKAAFKNNIISHLESIGVEWTHSSADVKAIYNKLNSEG
jgi:hypothetical protein